MKSHTEVTVTYSSSITQESAPGTKLLKTNLIKAVEENKLFILGLGRTRITYTESHTYKIL